MQIETLIAQARIGRELEDAKLGKWHSYSAVTTMANGKTLTCFFASKAPNSRGARRGRHDRIGFIYQGKEISKARAIELLGA